MRAVFLSRAYIDPANRGKLRALAGLGCSVAAAVPDQWIEPVSGLRHTAAWGEDAGVRIAPVRVRGDVWDRRVLRQLLRDFRPDIVQVEEEPWTPAAATTASIAARLAIPLVLYSAESVTPALGLAQAWRRKRTIGRAGGVLGQTGLAAGLLARDHAAVPSAVIPQLGVPIPRQLTPLPHDGFTIGFVGRLVHEKGCDLLLRACVGVLGSWNLILVGSGPAQEDLEALAERLGIASRITWMGALPQDRLAGVWPALDCLALPARTTARWVEPHGRAVLDAMGQGVPVIGSRSGALPEVIGEAGLVIPEDDVDALTAALQGLRDSRDRREALAAEGRRRVMAEFIDGALARKTLDFWERVKAAR